MHLFVTTLVGVSITVLYVLLSLRVINFRRTKIGPSIGLEGNERFVRAVRAHANLGEYAPLFLILLAISELQGADIRILTIVAVVFFAGRLMHAIGFGYLGTGPWRTLGMVCTNSALLFLAALLLYQVGTI